MIVGIPKEIKEFEKRVSFTPGAVSAMVGNGHGVIVERGAGEGSGFGDTLYIEAGAVMVEKKFQIYEQSDMVLHVKEPRPSEYDHIREGQILFSNLALEANIGLTKALMGSGAICIAWEKIEMEDGTLPVEAAMDEVKGCAAIQAGSGYLATSRDGGGILLGGLAGVEAATVVILGGGGVGMAAGKTACALGAKVYILDSDVCRLRYIRDVMPPNCTSLMPTPAELRQLVADADLIVGASIVMGPRSPVLVTKEMVKAMKKGAVIVDAAIDHGGCFETSRCGTFKVPAYVAEGIMHFSPCDLPGMVPATATRVLSCTTLPYLLEIADKGWKRASMENPHIKKAIGLAHGRVASAALSRAFDMEFTDIDEIIQAS
ncbi:MAG: alanine dehydrogenase [Desulfamplus sp.]|nr:alanine dehydrogenase [Desulfamplus sp.]